MRDLEKNPYVYAMCDEGAFTQNGISLIDYVAIEVMSSLLEKSITNHTSVFKRIKNIIGIGGGYSDIAYSSKEITREAYVIAKDFIIEREKKNT